MGKKKQKGNGTGTVYPRKNKDGKVIGYRGSYFAPDGKRRYVSAKKKGDAERALRQAVADLRGRGYEPAEIAKSTGLSEQAVTQILEGLGKVLEASFKKRAEDLKERRQNAADIPVPANYQGPPLPGRTRDNA